MKIETIASHGVGGSRWFRTWGFMGMSAAAIAIFAPPASALSLSRGQQTLDVPYQECLRRAHAAFVAEGFDAQPSQGASFVGGFRGSSGGYITCNPLTEGRMIVNVFVASEGTSDPNVPGAFRDDVGELTGRLQGNRIEFIRTGQWGGKVQQQRWTALLTQNEMVQGTVERPTERLANCPFTAKRGA
jgi:hypothetical protein